MDDVVYQCKGLSDSDIDLLNRVEEGMGILADINRADVLLYGQLTHDRAVVLAHARPHSVAQVYVDLLTGTWVRPIQQPLVWRTFQGELRLLAFRSIVANGAPIVQRALPVRNLQGRVVGVLCIETNLIEHERMRRRDRPFQWAVGCLQQMAARGELIDTDALTPFGEHDGILLIDRSCRIRYASGIAANLYRRLGLVEGLVGKNLSEIGTNDLDIASQVLDSSRAIEQQTREGERIWVKRGLPILSVFGVASRFSSLETLLGWRLERRVVGLLILIRDITESQLKEREIKVKTALIREVHHRVKNNLQTIAALLRMQARRSPSEEVRQALQEGINRILSVAVVHEFLAHQEERSVSLREVATKIVRQTRQGVMDPEKRIRMDLLGPDVLLQAQQATSCALIMNELLLNSIEHGFEGRNTGTIVVELAESDTSIMVSVSDDGSGLPADFDVDRAGSLGLQIVRTLVQDDLKGTFQIENSADGVRAVVTFSKSMMGGE